ncbi:MAG: hypothetical protein M5U12_34030 [Verrucomicrobia bacterium]|nr:hypothetical protein [Verrucomicrobiota bacterium]
MADRQDSDWITGQQRRLLGDIEGDQPRREAALLAALAREGIAPGEFRTVLPDRIWMVAAVSLCRRPGCGSQCRR